MARELHTHVCQACGVNWQCNNPGCEPGDDTCRACERDLADEYWQAREAQAVPPQPPNRAVPAQEF